MVSLDYLSGRCFNFSIFPNPGSPDSFSESADSESYCEDKDPLPHTLSKMYALLISHPDDFIMPSLSKWERDLDRTFMATQHQNFTHLCLISSICTRTQESNYKIFTLSFLTPSVLSKYFPEALEHCWRCGDEKGTFFHVFWSCSKLHHYWSEVQRISQQFTDFPIPRDPAFFLLHCSQMPIRTYKKSILRHLTNAAKACVTLCWKGPNPSSIAMWLNRVKSVNTLEDLVLTTQNKRAIYKNMGILEHVCIFERREVPPGEILLLFAL